MIKLDSLERKRRRDFFMICRTFQDNGVHTVEQALDCKDKLLSNSKKQIVVALGLAALTSLLFPSNLGAIVMGGIVVILYIISFTYRGRVFVQRYIDEILKHPDYKPEVNNVDEVAKTEMDKINSAKTSKEAVAEESGVEESSAEEPSANESSTLTDEAPANDVEQKAK